MTLSVTDDGADAAGRVWGSSSFAFEAQGFFVLMTALNLRLFFGRTTRFCFFGGGADSAGGVEPSLLSSIVSTDFWNDRVMVRRFGRNLTRFEDG